MSHFKLNPTQFKFFSSKKTRYEDFNNLLHWKNQSEQCKVLNNY
jgi:hypothetical protein